MKNILNLAGVRKLSKNQQLHIKGSGPSLPPTIKCCSSGDGCTMDNNQSLCIPGRCDRRGGCILF
ncbi:hypothetical protein [Aquimarina atlantica]|uniref:hypothetical protein n=1 Tax=Aquimarina atlantica TaxID=1317122 RepID=UPI000A9EB4B7|nr:hypothetical protein [Aquimarina atlantica]